MRLRRGTLRASVVGVVLFAACQPGAEIAFTLTLPPSLSGENMPAWIELGAMRGACPSASALGGGIPLGEATSRMVFPANAARAPTFGALSRERWAFMAAARDESCGVVALGCKSVDLNTATEVTLNLQAIDGPREGTCGAGTVCQYAHCIEFPATSTTSAEGCSLAVRGGGALVDPVTIDGSRESLASGPALAASGSSFFSSTLDGLKTGERLRVNRRWLGLDGIVLPRPDTDETPCTGTVERGGISLAAAVNGRVLEAKVGLACGAAATLAVSEFSPPSTDRNLFRASLPSGTVLRPHSLVREGVSGRSYLASTSPAGLRIEALDAARLGASVVGLPSPVASLLDVAASDSASLWLGRSLNGSAVAGIIKNGISQTIQVDAGSIAVASRGATFEILSLDGLGFVRIDRVSETGSPVSFTDFGKPTTDALITDATLVTSGEFTVVAVGVAGEVWLRAQSIQDATGMNHAWRRLSDSVPLARRRRDGALTLASAADAIALVWQTSENPSADDVPFGFAVARCEGRKP